MRLVRIVNKGVVASVPLIKPLVTGKLPEALVARGSQPSITASDPIVAIDVQIPGTYSNSVGERLQGLYDALASGEVFSLDVVRTAAEVSSAADVLSTESSKSLLEVLSTTEQTSFNVASAVVDTGLLDELLSKTLTMYLQDGATVSEIFSALNGGAMAPIDSSVAAESLTLSLSLLPADTEASLEMLVVVVSAVYQELAVTLEQVDAGVAKSLTEIASSSESGTITVQNYIVDDNYVVPNYAGTLTLF